MQNTFVTAYAEVLFYIKKVCFRHEQEFRIVIEIPEKKWNAILKNKEVCKIRVFNNIFVPYLDASIDLQAITGCTIAPAVKNDLAADSLKQFCNYVGLNPEAFTEGIAVSSIPVRF